MHSPKIRLVTMSSLEFIMWIYSHVLNPYRSQVISIINFTLCVTSYLGRDHSNDRYNYELIVDNVQIISYDMSFIPGLYLIQKQSYV